MSQIHRRCDAFRPAVRIVEGTNASWLLPYLPHGYYHICLMVITISEAGNCGGDKCLMVIAISEAGNIHAV